MTLARCIAPSGQREANAFPLAVLYGAFITKTHNKDACTTHTTPDRVGPLGIYIFRALQIFLLIL